MATQRYVALAILGVGLVLAGFAVLAPQSRAPVLPAPGRAPVSAPIQGEHAPETGAGDVAPASPHGTTHAPTPTSVPQPSATAETVLPDLLHASLAVGERTYDLPFREGETLYQAMRRLEQTGAITIEGKNFPGLGFFVEGLNGRRNGGGRYWIYSVNGAKASVGAEGYRLKADDAIVWTFEGAYQ